MNVPRKLTSYELDALNGVGYNLADGHARQKSTAKELKIIKDLPEIYLSSQNASQNELENNLLQVFFDLAGQGSVKNYQNRFFHYSASLAIESLAIVLAAHHQSIALVQPAFDNLADILRHSGIALHPVSEDQLLNLSSDVEIPGSAMFITLPNNPTGFELDKDQFQGVIDYCKKHQKILVVDFCFRFFSINLHKWDQYQMLLDSNIDFITYEDIGKTWSLNDLKFGIAITSDSLAKPLRDITHDMLLNVSPFVISLVTKYIEKETFPIVESRLLVEKNSAILQEMIEDSSVTNLTLGSSMPVAWLKFKGDPSNIQIRANLDGRGVYIMPGGPFFWNDHSLGEHYFRIALSRDSDYFSEAMAIIKAYLFE